MDGARKVKQPERGPRVTDALTDFRLVCTARLTLRAPTVEDEAVVFSIHGDPETNRHNPGGPMTSREGARGFLQAIIGAWAEHGFSYWCVSAGDAPAVIGFAGVDLMELKGRCFLNLYYRFTPAVWGRGYATEAAAEAIKVGRTARPDLPILARTRPANKASIRVAEKLGMKRTVWTPTRVVFEAVS